MHKVCKSKTYWKQFSLPSFRSPFIYLGKKKRGRKSRKKREGEELKIETNKCIFSSLNLKMFYQKYGNINWNVYSSSKQQLWTREASLRFSQNLGQKCCWVWWLRRVCRNPLRKQLLWAIQLRPALLYLKPGWGVDCRVCSVSLDCCMLFYSLALSILIAAIVIFPSLWKGFVTRCCLSFAPQ